MRVWWPVLQLIRHQSADPAQRLGITRLFLAVEIPPSTFLLRHATDRAIRFLLRLRRKPMCITVRSRVRALSACAPHRFLSPRLVCSGPPSPFGVDQRVYLRVLARSLGDQGVQLVVFHFAPTISFVSHYARIQHITVIGNDCDCPMFLASSTASVARLIARSCNPQRSVGWRWLRPRCRHSCKRFSAVSITPGGVFCDCFGNATNARRIS